MTKVPTGGPTDLATLAKDTAAVLVSQEVQLLHLIQAEVAVLGQMMGAGAKAHDPRSTEAEVEAGFDNMPV